MSDNGRSLPAWLVVLPALPLLAASSCVCLGQAYSSGGVNGAEGINLLLQAGGFPAGGVGGPWFKAEVAAGFSTIFRYDEKLSFPFASHLIFGFLFICKAPPNPNCETRPGRQLY